MRWSERRTAVRSTFEMTSTLNPKRRALSPAVADLILVRPLAYMTSLQRRTLTIWSKFRHRPMSIGALFWASGRTYLSMFVLFGLLAWFAYASFGLTGLALVAVAFFTALLRDLGYFIRSARVWPTIREFIDWSRVETALARDDAPPKA